MNLPQSERSVNPFGEQILEQLASEPERAWLALAWRQFLFWFADVENRLDNGSVTAAALLRNADSNWRTLDDTEFLMEERRNDGGWIRPWRRALTEFLTLRCRHTVSSRPAESGTSHIFSPNRKSTG
jgi:hypothetical protein